MRYFIFYSSFSFLFLLFSCKSEVKSPVIQEEEQEEIKQLDWIIGEWFHETEEGILFEDWTKKNDSIYLGKSYLIAQNDTIFSETLSLKIEQDTVAYESFVNNVNALQSKVFKGIYLQDAYFIVENHLQSFPRGIKYQSLNDTLLMIEISGFIDGEEEVQPYEMTRRTKK